MSGEKKERIKKAVIVFIKACIPPAVAFVSSVLTTLLGGDIGASTAVGSTLGIASGIVSRA